MRFIKQEVGGDAWSLYAKLLAFTLLVGVAQQATAAGSLLISEFRLRGPSGANDEYIEIYNDSASDHTVAAISGTGYGIAASDGVTRCSIPNATVIPARGHWLCTNSVAYSIGSYPAGSGTTATGDATYATDIPDNAGIALFNNNTGGGSYLLANRFDAVGSTSEANTLYKEGAGYPALTPFSIDYAFTRDTCGKGAAVNVMGKCTISSPKDTDNNAVDFYFVDTNGTSAGAGQRLGAPGPKNLSSPINSTTNTLGAALVDVCAAGTAAPNSVRDFTSDPANNSTFGTIEVRHTFTNNTGANITRLRFRVLDLDTFPAASGFADLRPRTSTSVAVTVDRLPCSSGTSGITVSGTTLEQPPSQPNGGGFNSTFSATGVTLGTPLANGASIDLRFLFGIQQTGDARVSFLAETLPAGGALVEFTGTTEAGLAPYNDAPTASSVSISGTAQVGQTLTGSYTYGDTESNPQDTSGTGSSYRFVRSTDNSVATTGDNADAATGTTGGDNDTYTVVSADAGKYLFYCVTPKATLGTLAGTETCSSATAQVLTPVNGTCGTAHATTPLVTSAPSGGALCSTGNASSVTTGNSAYTWTCAGINGGTDSGTCSASRGYTVTPSTGANGSISPNTDQVVAYNAQPQFTVTPSGGYSASVGGTCGGSLSGGTYTTNAVTAACTVVASFTVIPLPTTYSAPSPTGSGTVNTVLSGGGSNCGFASSSYVLAASAGGTPPAGATFPHGVLNFTTGTCQSGGTVDITITYPQALPAGTKFYKYGPATTGAPSTWYEHPATISPDRLSISYSVTDGGQGDSNGSSGIISDPAGPAVLSTSIPTLGEWAMILLACLMAAMVGLRSLRGRSGRSAV